MHEQVATSSDYLTLTEAAKIAPGRPSTNCVWRWCRRGVLSRGGDRIRLRHVRIGGMIYTRPEWFEDFGRTLAEADATYFDLANAAAQAARSNELEVPRRRRRARSGNDDRDRELDQIDGELDSEGL